LIAIIRRVNVLRFLSGATLRSALVDVNHWQAAQDRKIQPRNVTTQKAIIFYAA
jgi:hypothetical protein